MVVTLRDIGGMIYCPEFTLKYFKKRGEIKAHRISLICVSCLRFLNEKLKFKKQKT